MTLKPRGSGTPTPIGAGGSAGGSGRGGRFDFRAWWSQHWQKVLIGVVGLLVLFGAYVLYTLKYLPDPGKQDVLANTITVYDPKGPEIEQRNPQGQYHKVLTLSQMGNYGPRATLAAEGRNSYPQTFAGNYKPQDFEGAINWGATLRAGWVDVTSGRVQQGGSTITQQVTAAVADHRAFDPADFDAEQQPDSDRQGNAAAT